MSFRKAFEIQRKTIEDKTKKQVEALKFLKLVKQKSTIKDAIPEHKANKEAKNEIENNMNKTEQKVMRADLVYKTNMYIISSNMRQYNLLQETFLLIKVTLDDDDRDQQEWSFIEITTRYRNKARKQDNLRLKWWKCTSLKYYWSSVHFNIDNIDCH